jgi:LysE type translocator
VLRVEHGTRPPTTGYHSTKRYGLNVACIAGFGRLVAFSGMISIVAAGLAILLYASAWFFMAVKLIGATYLFWLAIQLWRTKPELHRETGRQVNKLKKLMIQEFLVAAGTLKRSWYLPRSCRSLLILQNRCLHNSSFWAASSWPWNGLLSPSMPMPGFICVTFLARCAV